MRSFNLAFGSNDTRQNALNRCCRCAYEWKDEPFGNATHHACPKCGSVYWRWLNYDRRD